MGILQQSKNVASNTAIWLVWWTVWVAWNTIVNTVDRVANTFTVWVSGAIWNTAKQISDLREADKWASRWKKWLNFFPKSAYSLLMWMEWLWRWVWEVIWKLPRALRNIAWNAFQDFGESVKQIASDKSPSDFKNLQYEDYKTKPELKWTSKLKERLFFKPAKTPPASSATTATVGTV